MDPSSVVSKWYNEKGSRCLFFYKNSHQNEIIELNKLLPNLKLKAKILDLGCGNGLPVDRLLIEKGYNVIGVDISKMMISEAKLNVPKAKFKLMNIYKLKFKRNEFDSVIAFFSLIHLEKIKNVSVFKGINRVLKSGGYFLFSVNEGKNKGYVDYFGKKVYFSQYTKKEITVLLKKQGFKAISSKSFEFGAGKAKKPTCII